MKSERQAKSDLIHGIYPVLEALRARKRAFERIYVAQGRSGPALEEIVGLARSSSIRVERVPRSRLDSLCDAKNHQGVVARVGPYLYRSSDDIFSGTGQGPALVLILDGVVDPMNLGSLIRSAEVAGATGVIITRERSAPMSAAAVKASAGAAEHVPVVRVINLARTIEEMKNNGFWIVGLEGKAETNIFDLKFNERLGLVVGGEGRGLRRLTQEKCDLLASIPQRGNIGSLNAAVAGGIAMFEYVRQFRGTNL